MTLVQLDDSITIPAPADDHCILRNFNNVEAGVTIVQAWLTVKRFDSDLDPGLFQKDINLVDNPGVGHIVADGTSGTITLRFDILPADSLLLQTGAKQFDIQVKTATGKIHTQNAGTIRAKKPEITKAS